jgi:hypothetical protein
LNDSDTLGGPLDSQLLTLLGHAAVPLGIKVAVRKSPGAQFYKCALQVNPFDYLGRHAKPTAFASETDYNTAVVEACRQENVHVVAITDHFCTATARGLADALATAGMHVLPGFEASSSEGVHLLCLFSQSMLFEEVERIIGSCGVRNLVEALPLSDHSCDKLMELISDCGGVTIAAHVCSASGLLTILKGQTAIDRESILHRPVILLAVVTLDPRCDSYCRAGNLLARLG